MFSGSDVCACAWFSISLFKSKYSQIMYNSFHYIIGNRVFIMKCTINLHSTNFYSTGKDVIEIEMFNVLKGTSNSGAESLIRIAKNECSTYGIIYPSRAKVVHFICLNVHLFIFFLSFRHLLFQIDFVKVYILYFSAVRCSSVYSY